ncbi:beta-galactosidase family protein [Streptomyces angustmyceticus]|uniref:Beta-galactosidase n=1 Tax=Streptomyces angustmyceticus TaxID=285578 RepID=A0A5J4LGS0_9ACTN|nr:beta-galactosidase family protein [Streptomyces angustmyceticus]GES29858.1 beta-galactosidase [Streptomyces angustmyceticus]
MAPFSRRGFLSAAMVGAASLGVAVGSGRTALAQAEDPRGLTLRGDAFLLDGKPFRILSGAFHYFRTHPRDWRDRLTRMRAMGLNTVETYVAWNFHQPYEKKADFTGWRDVAAFIRTADEAGLKVIVRPGPYICAEWDFGGLPAWLLKDKDAPLRRSDPAFERAVDAWFAELLPRLVDLQATRGGPVIALQVENEYGSYGDDHAYLEHLRDTMRAQGIDSLLFCSNGATQEALKAGSLPDLLSTVNFAGDPTGPFAELRAFQPDKPLFCTEFWDGWFDHWGEPHHTSDPARTAADVEKMLAAGASVNLYMAVGGTNFGWYAGANLTGSAYQPTVTSYDYDSPISESGELTEKFHAVREVLAKYATVPDTPLPATPPRMPAQRIAVRESVPLMASLDTLSTPLRRTAPVHMEALGQSYGLIHYRTRVRGPQGTRRLRVTGLGDRALVFGDGKRIGTFDRNQPEHAVDVTVTGGSTTLDLLVDPTGRINFGQGLNDPKGISGKVLLDEEEPHDWEIRRLTLDDLSPLKFTGDHTPTGPAFHRARVHVDTPADGFLAFPGWDKGMVWLNGFALGRYWSLGPQTTLYAPSHLWRRGSNELVVLEMERTGDAIEVRSAPDLG